MIEYGLRIRQLGMRPAFLLLLIGVCGHGCSSSSMRVVKDAAAAPLAPGADWPAGCTALASTLAPQFAGACTAVVRLDFATLGVLGHAVVCGQDSPTDEGAARVVANQVHFPTPAGQGDLRSGPASTDEWIFSVSPSDAGGVAAVSARTSLLVFAASSKWMGMGKIMLPSAWNTDDLGSGCPKPTSLPVRSFDIDTFATAAQLSAAADVVLSTSLPLALQQRGTLLDAVVLAYTPTIADDVLDTTHFEYVVFLNAALSGSADADP
jgi:hypothetical protein